MNGISEKEAGKILLLTLFWVIGYCCAAYPLIFLGWSVLFPCENQQLGTMFLIHLGGDIVIAILCLFNAKKTWLAEFTESIHGVAAYAAGMILIYASVKSFPDYSVFLNVRSIFVIVICAIVFTSFMKLHRIDSSKNVRCDNWWR